PVAFCCSIPTATWCCAMAAMRTSGGWKRGWQRISNVCYAPRRSVEIHGELSGPTRVLRNGKIATLLHHLKFRPINRGHSHGCRNCTDFIGRWLRRVSLPKPMVLHTDRVQLGHDRYDRNDHVLGLRVCIRRDQFVHGLLRAPLPSPQGKSGALRAREQEAG